MKPNRVSGSDSSERADMHVVEQFVRFAGIGVIGTAAHYATLIALVELLMMYPVAASTVGAVIGALINYYLNYLFTFRSTERHRKALPKFLVVATAGVLLNAFIMYILTALVFLHYLLSQVVATTLQLLWNFVANRCWTFARNET